MGLNTEVKRFFLSLVWPHYFLFRDKTQGCYALWKGHFREEISKIWVYLAQMSPFFRNYGKMLLNSLLEVAGNSMRKFWLNGKAPIIWVSDYLTDQNVCLTNQTADWRAEVHWLFGDTSQPIVTWSTFCDIKRSQSLLLATKTEHKRRVRATASV